MTADTMVCQGGTDDAERGCLHIRRNPPINALMLVRNDADAASDGGSYSDS
ncbi:hypothetical protein NY08_4071 [Rhodococcus sp. B7740]|nr:hypothetical protein NY08_4071 [Rhodococcus sp. B7740]